MTPVLDAPVGSALPGLSKVEGTAVPPRSGARTTLETFFEKFALFADAPDAVEKMRELIYILAVQGRLVPQDQTEEPASILLENIHEARAALPANRRLRDEIEMCNLDGDSAPYTAPPGWIWTSLGDVQVFTNGYAFKSEDYQPSGVGIIRMGELGVNGEVDETGMKYVSDEIAQSLPDTFRVRPGDLLMGMSGSIGKLAINRSNTTYLLNQRVGRLEPILIEKAFLHVFLKTVEQHYLRISFGMAIKNLSTKQINETPFPLPPIAEQKRIVAKVDELMALCDRLEAQQQERETRHAALARASLSRFDEAPTPANLNFLFHKSYPIPPADRRKSILTLAVQGKLVPQDPSDEPAEELLARISAEQKRLVEKRETRRLEIDTFADGEEPFAIPATWAWTRLGQIGDWGSGSTPPRGNNELYGGNVPWLKSGELNDNRMLAGSEESVTELAVETCSFRQNKPGDVLLAMYGATIGKAAILAEAAVTNQAVCGCTPFAGVLNIYLFDYLLSQRHAFRAASEGGAQPNISKVKIVGHPFHFHPSPNNAESWPKWIN